MVILVLSRLDNGSALLAGPPQHLIDKLQSVQNATARLGFSACRHDHITPLLQRLYSLNVAERITLPLAVLTYRCLHGSASEHLSKQVSNVGTRRRPLDQSCHHRWYIILCYCDLSVEQLVKSDSLMCMYSTVQEFAGDGTVLTIMRRQTV